MKRNPWNSRSSPASPFNRDEAKLTIRGVPDIPGVAFKILGPISAANVEVDMIVQNVAHDNTTDFHLHRAPQ